jgi:hypothetical protein
MEKKEKFFVNSFIEPVPIAGMFDLLALSGEGMIFGSSSLKRSALG